MIEKKIYNFFITNFYYSLELLSVLKTFWDKKKMFINFRIKENKNFKIFETRKKMYNFFITNFYYYIRMAFVAANILYFMYFSVKLFSYCYVSLLNLSASMPQWVNEPCQLSVSVCNRCVCVGIYHCLCVYVLHFILFSFW